MGGANFETKAAYDVTVQVADAALGSSLSQAFHLDITNVNEAPSGADKTITMAEDSTRVFSAADFGFSDLLDTTAPNAFQSVIVTSLPGSGSLVFNGNPVTLNQEIPVASLGQLSWTPAANANGNALANFSFAVRDNGGTGRRHRHTDQTPNTITFNVTPVGDPTTGTVNIVSESRPGPNQVTLNAGNSLVDPDGPITVAYQWSNGTNGASTTLTAGAAVQTITLAAAATDTVNGITTNFAAPETAFIGVVGNNNISGTAGADYIVGFGGVDNLFGGDGNDILSGGDGADILYGGTGANTFIGGDGGDWFIMSQDGTIVETATGGFDVIQTGSFNVDLNNYANVEMIFLVGSQNISATGDAQVNYLYGETNSASNALAGGGGSDWYYIGVGDTITEAAGGGTQDLVASSTLNLDLQNYANVEIASLQGAANLSVFGTASSDYVSGNLGNNTITGRGGADQLRGLGGNDTFAFATGFGNDFITDFNADESDALNHDVLDISSFGITDLTFGPDVTIATDGVGGTLITIQGDVAKTIQLLGINSSTVGIDDFLLAP